MGPLRMIKIGSRGSPLALWQARYVAERLRATAPGLEVEIVAIRTAAENFPDRPPEAIGVGIFTKEIDEQLLDGRIDLGVHSMKDIPSQLHPALAIAAVPERESPLDAFVGSPEPAGPALELLPKGATVGTGSPRRKAQLLLRRPDLRIVPLRGNVDTRIAKSREQGMAGTILAHAGLRRLGREETIRHLIAPEWIVPAVGQGALCIAARADRAEMMELAARLDHVDSRLRIVAERAFLAELRGGCQVPAGALAEIETAGGSRILRIRGVLAAPDGLQCVRGERSGPPERGAELGRGLAIDLLGRGGREILASLRTASAAEAPPSPAAEARADLAGRTLVITRSEDRGEGLRASLEGLGARVLSIPTIRFAPPEDPAPLEAALDSIESYRWLLFTSATAVHFFFAAARSRRIPLERFGALRIGVVGPATASALTHLSLKAARIAAAGDAASLAAALVGPKASEPLGPADRCLLPQADISRGELAEALKAAGVPVTAVTAYETQAEDPERVKPFLSALEGDEPIDGIVFASPSALRSFLAMTHPHGEHAIREKPIRVFSIGPTTTAAIRERGLQVAREAAPHTTEALVEAIAETLLQPVAPETGIIPDEPGRAG